MQESDWWNVEKDSPLKIKWNYNVDERFNWNYLFHETNNGEILKMWWNWNFLNETIYERCNKNEIFY